MGDRLLTLTHNLAKKKNFKIYNEMKKTYIEPTLLVHKIKPCQMICNSVRGVTGLGSVKKGTGDFAGGASDARGAEFSDWDEEE